LRPAPLAADFVAEAAVPELVAEDACDVVSDAVVEAAADEEPVDEAAAEPEPEDSAAAICAETEAENWPDMLLSVNFAEKASAGTLLTFAESDWKRTK